MHCSRRAVLMSVLAWASAVLRGDLRHAGQFGDLISDDWTRIA